MWVTSDPLDSLSFPLDQATMIRATSSRGVQVDLVGKEELTKMWENIRISSLVCVWHELPVHWGVQGDREEAKCTSR